jgi:hypothetical protein
VSLSAAARPRCEQSQTMHFHEFASRARRVVRASLCARRESPGPVAGVRPAREVRAIVVDSRPPAEATVPAVEPVEMVAAKLRRRRDVGVCSISHREQTSMLLVSRGFGRQPARARSFRSGRFPPVSRRPGHRPAKSCGSRPDQQCRSRRALCRARPEVRSGGGRVLDCQPSISVWPTRIQRPVTRLVLLESARLSVRMRRSQSRGRAPWGPRPGRCG